MSVEGMFCSCLEKIFPDESAGGTAGFRAASALRGERFSLQFAFRCSGYYSTPVVFEVDSPLKKYIRVRRVALVPVHYPGSVGSPWSPSIIPVLSMRMMNFCGTVCRDYIRTR